jgi:hypothetical protein
LPPLGTVAWKASGADEFRVIFQDIDQDKWIWPFDGSDDGTHGSDNAPSLKVTGAGTTKTLRAGVPSNIKYEVHCTSSASADPLDPMIIIRPSRVSDGVALAVTCAVLGAIVGSAATYMLLT